MWERIGFNISEETKAFLMKIIIPAMVALSIKIAIVSQQKKISIFQIVTSFITGIGAAYLFSDLVLTTFSHQWIPLIIATVTISGEKIGYYLIYKLKVEDFLEGVINKYKLK